MRRTAQTKSWPKMSPSELARATRAFDDPNFVPSPVREPAELAQRHRKALTELRARARATRESDAAQVRVTLERGLLRRTDELASARGVNRSQVIAEGLALLLGGK